MLGSNLKGTIAAFLSGMLFSILIALLVWALYRPSIPTSGYLLNANGDISRLEDLCDIPDILDSAYHRDKLSILNTGDEVSPEIDIWRRSYGLKLIGIGLFASNERIVEVERSYSFVKPRNNSFLLSNGELFHWRKWLPIELIGCFSD